MTDRPAPEATIEYGIREDWGFLRGIELIMPAGTDEAVARQIGEMLADAKGKPHSLVYRRVGEAFWSEDKPPRSSSD